jgi:predicted MFS family arabinose efflux permease
MAVGLNFSGAAFFGGQIISSHGYPFYFSIAAVLSLASLAILAARFRSVPQ